MEPIIVTVLDNYGADPPAERHLLKLEEYLSMHLSIRDRKQIIDVLVSCISQRSLLPKVTDQDPTLIKATVQTPARPSKSSCPRCRGSI